METLAKRHQCPDKFKKIRNHVNNVINRSRNEYFKKYFIEHSKNAKKVWEGIRCAIEWHKTKSSNITSVTDTSGIKHNDPNLYQLHLPITLKIYHINVYRKSHKAMKTRIMIICLIPTQKVWFYSIQINTKYTT